MVESVLTNFTVFLVFRTPSAERGTESVRRVINP